MGVTPLRPRIGLAALLLAVATASCTPSDDGAGADADPGPWRPSTVTTRLEERAGNVGGSRHLAYTVQSGGARPRIVVEDLVEGTIRVVAEGGEPYGAPDVSADGAVAWGQYDESSGNTAYVLLAGADEPVRIDGGCPRWRRDGALLVTSIGRGDVVPHVTEVDTATGELTDVGVTLDLRVCAVPAGDRHVVYARPTGGDTQFADGAEIVRLPLGGGAEQVVGHLAPSCYPLDVDVSPDGRGLAVTVSCPDDLGPEHRALLVGTMADDLAPLVAENAVGTPIADSYQYRGPSWSADGSQIVYHRTVANNTAPTMWRVAAAGGEPVEIGAAGGTDPALSRGPAG